MKSKTLVTLLVGISLLLTLSIAQRAPAQEQPQGVCPANAGWQEMGAGSACGGGLARANGYNTYVDLAAGPDGSVFAAISSSENYPKSKYQVSVLRWNGLSWADLGSKSAADGGISDNAGDSLYPSIAVLPSGKPIVAWSDTSSGNYEIYVRLWSGTAWVEMGSGSASGGGISKSSGNSSRPSLAVDADGAPVVAWYDDSSGAYQIYVMRWNGSTWVELGSRAASERGISRTSGASVNPSLAINQFGTLVVAWQDDSSGNEEIYVRRWTGKFWEEIGVVPPPMGASARTADFPDRRQWPLLLLGKPSLPGRITAAQEVTISKSMPESGTAPAGMNWLDRRTAVA